MSEICLNQSLVSDSFYETEFGTVCQFRVTKFLAILSQVLYSIGLFENIFILFWLFEPLAPLGMLLQPGQ